MYLEMYSTYQLIIFPEVVSFLAVSMTFNIPAIYQHSLELSMYAVMVIQKGEQGGTYGHTMQPQSLQCFQ